MMPNRNVKRVQATPVVIQTEGSFLQSMNRGWDLLTGCLGCGCFVMIFVLTIIICALVSGAYSSIH